MDPRSDDFYARLGTPRDATAEQIAKAFRRAVRAHPPESDRDAYQAIAEAYAVLGNPEKRAAYDARAATSPALASALEHVRMAEMFGDFGRACDLLRDLLLTHADRRDLALEYVRLAVAAERFEEARPIARRLVDDDPNDVESALRLAELLIAWGRAPEESERLLMHAASLRPEDGGILLRLADLQLRTGRHAAAVASCERAYAAAGDRVPQRLTALVELAACAVCGDDQSAVAPAAFARLKKALDEADPQERHFGLGRIWFAAQRLPMIGRRDAARALVQFALSLPLEEHQRAQFAAMRFARESSGSRDACSNSDRDSADDVERGGPRTVAPLTASERAALGDPRLPEPLRILLSAVADAADHDALWEGARRAIRELVDGVLGEHYRRWPHMVDDAIRYFPDLLERFEHVVHVVGKVLGHARRFYRYTHLLVDPQVPLWVFELVVAGILRREGCERSEVFVGSFAGRCRGAEAARREEFAAFAGKHRALLEFQPIVAEQLSDWREVDLSNPVVRLVRRARKRAYGLIVAAVNSRAARALFFVLRWTAVVLVIAALWNARRSWARDGGRSTAPAAAPTTLPDAYRSRLESLERDARRNESRPNPIKGPR